MSVGHIQLGNPGALRPYLLHNYREYQAATVNPLAARINTSEKYGTLEDISEWVMDDWQVGAGQKDAEAGGFLYATLDTAAPNQIMLPPACVPNPKVGVPCGVNYPAAFANNAITRVEANEKIAIRIYVSTGGLTVALHTFFFARCSGSIRMSYYEDNAGEIGDKIDECICLTNLLRPHVFSWWMPSHGTVLGAGSHWLVLESVWNDSIEFMASQSTLEAKRWNPETEIWEDKYFSIRAYAQFRAAECFLSATQYFVRGRSNKVYVSTAGYETAAPGVYSGASVASLNTAVSGLPANKTPTTLANVGDYIYVGYGDEANAFSIKIADDSVADLGYKIWESLIYNGYFWRSVGSKLYYSTDLATWHPNEGIDTGDTAAPIISIAGAGGNVYMATKRGLYMAAPGDFPVQILGFTPNNNHVALLGLHDSLYIIAEQQLFIMDVSGQVTEIWTSRHKELDLRDHGTPVAMAHSRNTLYVLSTYDQSAETGRFRVSAWVQGGWQYVASGHIKQAKWTTSPYKPYLGSLTNDSSQLYVLGDANVIWSINVPVASANTWYQASDASTDYSTECEGWIEFPKFYGGPQLLIKDWDNIVIFGDYLDERYSSIDVYWRNGDYTSWQLLGRLDSENVTQDGTRGRLNWSLSSRPCSEYIQLALRVRSQRNTYPVRITAIRLQFNVNLADRWRWPLTIEVSDDQQMLDGELNSYTAAQMRTHLNGLIEQAKPFYFKDIDGTQYTVRVESARWNLDEVEYYNGKLEVKWLLSLTLLQPMA